MREMRRGFVARIGMHDRLLAAIGGGIVKGFGHWVVQLRLVKQRGFHGIAGVDETNFEMHGRVDLKWLLPHFSAGGEIEEIKLLPVEGQQTLRGWVEFQHRDGILLFVESQRSSQLPDLSGQAQSQNRGGGEVHEQERGEAKGEELHGSVREHSYLRRGRETFREKFATWRAAEPSPAPTHDAVPTRPTPTVPSATHAPNVLPSPARQLHQPPSAYPAARAASGTESPANRAQTLWPARAAGEHRAADRRRVRAGDTSASSGTRSSAARIRQSAATHKRPPSAGERLETRGPNTRARRLLQRRRGNARSPPAPARRTSHRHAPPRRIYRSLKPSHQ